MYTCLEGDENFLISLIQLMVPFMCIFPCPDPRISPFLLTVLGRHSYMFPFLLGNVSCLVRKLEGTTLIVLMEVYVT
jgi:hypothetical protein